MVDSLRLSNLPYTWESLDSRPNSSATFPISAGGKLGGTQIVRLNGTSRKRNGNSVLGTFYQYFSRRGAGFNEAAA